jgi:hypothetical protein
MTSSPSAASVDRSLCFPPALARLARERLTPMSSCLSGVTNDELVRLLTTVFFAGLETYEGEHHPICVAFVGRTTDDLIITDASTALAPLYRWKILRFESPRPFSPRDLAKLAVASADRRMYSAVGVLENGTLAITGLAREGVNTGPDPFVKIVTSRPGCLSIRSGRDLVIEYERGTILAVSDDQVFADDGSVYRALTAIARDAGVDEEVIPQYLDAVSFLVREMIAHGHGGILIISSQEHPPVTESAPYAMVTDSSLAALLRLAWRIGGGRAPELTPRGGSSDAPNGRPGAANGSAAGGSAFGQLLRSAFLTEAERVAEEIGRLTAIDGAVLLNRDLALTAFGVILPVGRAIVVEEGIDGENGQASHVDFGNRGTRHRAAATYAAEYPGSVVFLASADGQVSCLLCEQTGGPVRLWHLDAETTYAG